MGFWSWFKRPREPAPRAVQPRPPDWSRTIEDLMSEKRTIPAQEIEWARSLERDRLRPWARFPKDGEIFEALEGAQVGYLVHWQAPFTGGDRATLPKGTRVRVSVDARQPEPIVVTATALDDGRLERQLVPESERRSRKYGGFSLSIGVAELNRDFRRVEGA